MTTEQAQQIAELLNSRNSLATRYTADRVKQSEGEYVYQIEAGEIVACVQVKKVQWYQSEILHLSVRADQERKGRGRRMLELAEKRAKEQHSRIAQCTIRVGNVASEGLFQRFGYREQCRFKNAGTGNEVAVFQKVLQ